MSLLTLAASSWRGPVNSPEWQGLLNHVQWGVNRYVILSQHWSLRLQILVGLSNLCSSHLQNTRIKILSHSSIVREPLNSLFEIANLRWVIQVLNYRQITHTSNPECAESMLWPRFIHAGAGSRKSWTSCLARILAPLNALFAFPTHYSHVEREGNVGVMTAQIHNRSAPRPVSKSKLAMPETFMRSGRCAVGVCGGLRSPPKGALNGHLIMTH